MQYKVVIFFRIRIVVVFEGFNDIFFNFVIDPILKLCQVKVVSRFIRFIVLTL